MGLQKKQEGQYELRLVHLKHLDPELFGISDFSDILKFLHILNRVSWHWNASLGIKCVHKTCYVSYIHPIFPTCLLHFTMSCALRLAVQ